MCYSSGVNGCRISYNTANISDWDTFGQLGTNYQTIRQFNKEKQTCMPLHIYLLENWALQNHPSNVGLQYKHSLILRTLFCPR